MLRALIGRKPWLILSASLVACAGGGADEATAANESVDAAGTETTDLDAGPPDDAAAPADTATTADSGTSGGGDTSVAETGGGGLKVGCTMPTTADLNLRSGPSTADPVLHVIPNGDTVTLLSATASGGFLNVSHGGESGWASAMYLDTASCTTGTGTPSAAAIESIATASSCASYSWKDRGAAPKGYIAGVALVFARAVCAPTRADVVLVSKARTTDDVHDALAWYQSIFSGLGMSNDTAGVDTLRHAYTLLMGLGMRESSGQHCVGRDASATNTSSDSAEAGAWQTSWDSRSFHAELPKIFAKYRTSDVGCFLSTFKKGVTCSDADWKNWGTGIDGLDFQRREKECPTMAAEYAALMLRVSGGSVGHYGPLRTKAAEVRTECDAMLKKVQTYVADNPGVCAGI